MSLLLGMCAFSLVMSITPGPVNIATLSSGARYGAVSTLPFVLGATMGFTLLLAATGVGIVKIAGSYPSLMQSVSYLGCIFILYLAYQIGSSTETISESQASSPHFSKGFILQWLNPKAWAASAAGTSAFVTAGSYQVLALFCAVYFTICFLSIACWAVAGQKLAGWLNTGRKSVVFHRVLGGVLATMALYLVIELT